MNYLVKDILGMAGVMAATMCGDRLMDVLNGKNPWNLMPLDSHLREGFVKPSEIEIKLKDLDGSGQNSTIARIKEKDYLLIYTNGRPVIQAYEIKPAQVVPMEQTAEDIIPKRYPPHPAR